MFLAAAAQSLTKRMRGNHVFVDHVAKSISSKTNCMIRGRPVGGAEVNDSRRGQRTSEASTSTSTGSCVVNSHTEWDPLEEVIVGRVEGATIPEWHVSGQAVWPAKHWDMYKSRSGQPFPRELAKRGTRSGTLLALSCQIEYCGEALHHLDCA